jgi:hypothetical protein
MKRQQHQPKADRNASHVFEATASATAEGDETQNETGATAETLKDKT